MWANLHVMCHMYEIVEQRSLTDHRVSETAPVDTGVGPDIRAVADANPAKLRHPPVALFGTGPHESEPGLPNSGSSTHTDVRPDHRANDRRIGVNARARPKNHTWSDRRIVTNPGAFSELCPRADYGPGFDPAVRRDHGILSDSRISANGGTGKRGRIERVRHPSECETRIFRRQAHRLRGNFGGQSRGCNAASGGSREATNLRPRHAEGQGISTSLHRGSHRGNELAAVFITLERGTAKLGQDSNRQGSSGGKETWVWHRLLVALALGLLCRPGLGNFERRKALVESFYDLVGDIDLLSRNDQL